MKIKEGFIIRKIANTDMVVPIGQNIADFNGVITLNESAAFLWKRLKEGSEIPNLVDALIREYNIKRELAQRDVENFVARLQLADMLEEI